MDFFSIATKATKQGIEVYPKFRITKSEDLMIRGGDFYAIWNGSSWSTDESEAINLIDSELKRYSDELKKDTEDRVRTLYLWDAESGMIDRWHKYCQKQMRDYYHPLDEKIVFANDPVSKEDYSSKRLGYPLEDGSIENYNKLISTLYSSDERLKIEWAIGSIIAGASKDIQKFLVFYGAAGTGKSTILNIVQMLFEGYYAVFDAKALGSSNNAFALEAFKTNPLVAIQHDGDLSKIEDNTRLNSLVSHELMTVNEKFKSTYSSRFNSFLFMGTNKPVRITDSRSGLLRRLIDVSPTGDKLSQTAYKKCMSGINFELGAIASHCLHIYLSNQDAFDDYVPVNMIGASNDFYNFVVDNYKIFSVEDGVSLTSAWAMYKEYAEDANLTYTVTKRVFKEELKAYFNEFKDRHVTEDGERVRSYYKGFRIDKFSNDVTVVEDSKDIYVLKLDHIKSVLDEECSKCHAQYATEKETPMHKWYKVNTYLRDLDTSRLHYLKLPENHIVIDFDLKDSDGNKSLKLNLEAASKWPRTYAEVSKGGQGVHLHYIYSGDVSKLKPLYDTGIEVKIFKGNASLRRRLSLCNNEPIAKISSGLPEKKEVKKVLNSETVVNEKGIRTLIINNLKKEYHPGTKPSVEFIKKILDDAYANGVHYDVTDMQNSVIQFALGSTHHADYCLKLTEKMHWQSEDASEPVGNGEPDIVFYDVEVFPNLFLVNYKFPGDKDCVRLINPKPEQIENLIKHDLIGFNNRRYDNHILYGRLMGYTNEQLYDLSQKIISSGKNGSAFFREAYNISYTDVYDFAAKKQSLKKWEIELGIHHQELGLPWDQPVPEHQWVTVAEYCDNDVHATEAVFNHLFGDFTARKILAALAGMDVNATTNQLTTRIIFGSNKNPQVSFNYRDMGDTTKVVDGIVFPQAEQWDYCAFDKENRPIFPGYTFDNGKSIYRDEEVGEGGYVYAEPGIYYDVALLDVASMHPSSIIAEKLFGDEYTQRFADIRDARVAIKHKDFDKARTMLNGKLAPFLDDESVAKDLAQALKIAINSVYGLTSARFPNAFRDERNIDNIVAKRGALFMINLKHEVQAKGYTVVHIKTDSIKIANADRDIIKFVMDYGKLYGYIFEHEATYERMCLVNDAVYVAKYDSGEWTATGAQFKVPYIFKKLFSHKELEFSDFCESKSVTSSIYLDFNEDLGDSTELDKELKKLIKNDAPEKDILTLKEEIAKMHKYVFVGKVGLFCPIKSGYGGGELLYHKNEKYYSLSGAKGYRWLEAEEVEKRNLFDAIDDCYYENLLDEALKAIGKYGNVKIFLEGGREEPPWKMPCGKESCKGCKYFTMNEFDICCDKGEDISDYVNFINSLRKDD